MNKRRALIAVAIALLTGAALVAYFRGTWIPNFPPKSAFPVRGIDVSRHQGAIQWRLIPHDEVQFVYIKATEGGDSRDSRFAENWKTTADAGLRRGAYHFFTLKTPGSQQAANFTAVVPNEPDALPPAIDLEFWGNSSVRPPVAEFQRELNAFISAVRSFYGREPVLYTAMDFKTDYLDGFPVPRLWIRSVITAPRLPNSDNWIFWQFSEKMRVRGIEGFVDHNVFKGNNDEFQSFINRRGSPSP